MKKQSKSPRLFIHIISNFFFKKKRPLPVPTVLFVFLKCSLTVDFVICISFQLLFQNIEEKNSSRICDG